jgi:phosphoglycerate dehydrogenase-like enzyme
MPTIIIEDDKILRALQVILDPATSQARCDGLQDYFAVDVPDISNWLAELRTTAGSLYPTEVRMVGDQAALNAALPHADALVVEGLTIGVDELAVAPKLRLVQKFGIDTRNIDLAACEAANMPVASVRRRTSGAVCEQVFALLFALTRKTSLTDGQLDMDSLTGLGFKPKMHDTEHISGANWARVTGLRTLEDMTLGLIGLGEIGREIAPRAAAFGMEVIYHQRTPLPDDIAGPLGATYVPMDELLARSDAISLQVPLNASTEGLIGREEFARMKPGAYLINISRAPIVDRAALIETLDSGRLGGAGFDVHYAEPGVPDEPLKNYPNVVLTPHTAPANRQRGMDDLAEVVGNLARVLGAQTKGNDHD